MTFILQNWINLINQILNHEHSYNGIHDEESIQTLKMESEKEQVRVRELLVEKILERTEPQDKQQWVQINQLMLTRLIDKLYVYKKAKDWEVKYNDLLNAVGVHLEDTLNFMKEFFGNFFAFGETLPLSFLKSYLKEFSCQVKQLEKKVQPCRPYIHALAEMLINNFNKFCDDKKKGATYQEMCYQLDLIQQLLSNETLQCENSINAVLFYFNYNDPNYLSYLKEKLIGLTEVLDTTKEKIVALLLEQKRFNQLPARLIGNLDNNTPSLLEQINHWIDEEIKFLKEQDIQNESERSGGKEKIYVNVPFKGTEIYLLHKAFIDSGGALGETYKSFFEKTATHITNKNQKGFSIESMQKNSDKVNYEAKENVKRFLQKMIRNVDSY